MYLEEAVNWTKAQVLSLLPLLLNLQTSCRNPLPHPCNGKKDDSRSPVYNPPSFLQTIIFIWYLAGWESSYVEQNWSYLGSFVQYTFESWTTQCLWLVLRSISNSIHLSNYEQVPWLASQYQYVCKSVVASQSVARSVSWSCSHLTLGLSFWHGNNSNSGVNCLTYPFSRPSSWPFRSRGNWLGLIIKQEYSFTPFKLQELKFVFLLTHAFY